MRYQPPSSKKTKQMLFGLAYILLFVLVLFIGLAYKYSENINLSDLKSFFVSSEDRQQKFEDAKNNISQRRIVDEESTIIEVVEKVSPAVVSIVVETVGFDVFNGPFSSEDGIGTGFIVDSNGLIVTNSHVVDSIEGEYSVVTSDGQTFDVENINLDPATDLAIIEIVARDLPVVELGDSDSVKVGQTAVAIGNALGNFDNTVTVGVVSGISREVTVSSGSFNVFGNQFTTYESLIQTDAALNPGNSGGPLLNSGGQVIGINVATTRGADNIAFSIPVNTLKPILESFLEEGRIVKPFIGISYSIVSPELSEIRDIPEGAFISGIVPDSPAEDADLRRGDVIIEFNGVSVNEENSISKLISGLKVGDRVEVVIDRDGRSISKTVTLGEVPQAAF